MEQTEFRNVGIQNSDSGELPIRKHKHTELICMQYRLILPKIHYNLIKLNIYLNLKAIHPPCVYNRSRSCVYTECIVLPVSPTVVY